MSKTANVPSEAAPFDGSYVPFKDGKVDTDVKWRADDGTLMHYNSEGVALAVVFSISASCSEPMNDLIDSALRDFNDGKKKEDQSSRAEWIRVVVADKIGYDLSQEPERERGSGLVVYREKVAKATKTHDALVSVLDSNPELAATLKALGIEL